jgi:hypothetical protein
MVVDMALIFAPNVIVPAPLFPSINTSLDEIGVDTPPAPPEVCAQ